MNDEFLSISELYQRVQPALRTKVSMLQKDGIFNVSKEDIWKLLMDKWKRGKGLTLFDIVNDILRLDEDIIMDELKYNRE